MPGPQFELMTQHNPQQHEPYMLESFFTPSPKENAELSKRTCPADTTLEFEHC